MVITNVNQVVYQGDGLTTAFPFTFRIIDATDIKLLLLDSDGTETDITSDYFVDTENDTVHYPGYAPGAEPALSDRPPVLAEGQKLVIYRKLPITQEKDLGDKWPFSVIELGLDKLTMILQDIWDWLGRCLYVSKGQAYEAGDDFDPTIPLEADKVICGNANGNGFEAREAMMEVNGAWDGEGRQIHSVADPTSEQDAVTKKYADTRMDNNFMKLQADGTAWEGRNLPIGNVANPVLQQQTATKNYVDSIIAGIVAAGNDVVVLDNVATMKATDLTDGMYVTTAGYHEVNDGGNGFYAVRASQVGDVDDGGSIIILNNGNVAKLITNGTVNVKQFGAYGDGTHADETTTAIQKAIIAFNSVFFPAGQYLISQTINITRPTKLIGVFANEYFLSALKVDNTTDGIYLNANGCCIENIGVIGDGETGTNEGIVIGESSNAFQTTLRNVFVKNVGGNGFFLKACNNGVFDNVMSLYNGGNGFEVDSSSLNRSGNYYNLTNLYGNGGCGLILSGEGNTVFCVSQSNTDDNIKINNYGNGNNITAYTEFSQNGYELNIVGNECQNKITGTFRSNTNKQFNNNTFYNDITFVEDYNNLHSRLNYLHKHAVSYSNNSELINIGTGLSIYNGYAGSGMSNPVPYTGLGSGLIVSAYDPNLANVTFCFAPDGQVYFQNTNAGAWSKLIGKESYASTDFSSSYGSLDANFTHATVIDNKFAIISVRFTASESIASFTSFITIPISVKQSFAKSGSMVMRTYNKTIINETPINSGTVLEFSLTVALN